MNATNVKKRKNQPDPIKNCLFASSHGCDHHHFPEHFDSLMSGNPRFSTPEYLAIGGQKIDNHFVENIKTYLAENDGKRNLVILMIGGNNIRRKGSGDTILPYFEDIVKQVAATERAHLIICGLVPSPPHEETFNTKDRFSEADHLLSDLAEQNKAKCTFFPTAKYFCQEGKSVRRYYEKEGEDVHLNSDGAKYFAQHLFDMVRNLPKEKFNFSQEPGKKAKQ